MFKCCLEALSKISIAKVEKKGKAMYVHEASDIDEQAIPSLSSVFDSEDDKEAAIACMASSAAVPFVRALLEHMLPGQCLFKLAIIVLSQINLLDIINTS